MICILKCRLPLELDRVIGQKRFEVEERNGRADWRGAGRAGRRQLNIRESTLSNFLTVGAGTRLGFLLRTETNHCWKSNISPRQRFHPERASMRFVVKSGTHFVPAGRIKTTP